MSNKTIATPEDLVNITDKRTVTGSTLDSNPNKRGMDVKNSDLETKIEESKLLASNGPITIVPLTTTGWTRLPANPVANRISVNVLNDTNYELELKGTNSGAYGTGMPVAAGDERLYNNIKPTFELYARLEPGGSGSVRVEELTT